MENERKKLENRLASFPQEACDKLQLVRRYLQCVFEDPDDSYRRTLFLVSPREIENAHQALKKGNDTGNTMTGMIRDGFCVQQDDLHAIYAGISDFLKEAKKIVEAKELAELEEELCG